MTIPENMYSGPDKATRGSISDVAFSNITYHPNNIHYLYTRLIGNSSGHLISNLSFDNFKIGDVTAESLDDFNASSAFLSNVTFTHKHSTPSTKSTAMRCTGLTIVLVSIAGVIVLVGVWTKP